MRTAFDHATPSGNAMMLEVLASLFYVTGDNSYRGRAETQIAAFAGEAVRNAIPIASLLSGIDFFLNGTQIVIRVGEGTDTLLRVVHDCCVPNRLLSVLAAGEECPEGHPAHGKKNIGNRETAYVCVGNSCSLPFTDADALRHALAWQPIRCSEVMKGTNDGGCR